MVLYIEIFFNIVLMIRVISVCLWCNYVSISMELSRRGENEKDRKKIVMLLIYKINIFILDIIMIVKCNIILIIDVYLVFFLWCF